jgi:uncharacterized protein YuzE
MEKEIKGGEKMNKSTTFYASYDSEEDVLFAHSDKVKTEESVEVLDDIVIDIDKNNNLAGLEIFNASEFFKLLNKKITKKVLEDMKNVKISIQTYRNYVLIAIGFQIDGKLVEEKLPAVSLKEYESPLVASVAA